MFDIQILNIHFSLIYTERTKEKNYRCRKRQDYHLQH